MSKAILMKSLEEAQHKQILELANDPSDFRIAFAVLKGHDYDTSEPVELTARNFDAQKVVGTLLNKMSSYDGIFVPHTLTVIAPAIMKKADTSKPQDAVFGLLGMVVDDRSNVYFKHWSDDESMDGYYDGEQRNRRGDTGDPVIDGMSILVDVARCMIKLRESASIDFSNQEDA